MHGIMHALRIHKRDDHLRQGCQRGVDEVAGFPARAKFLFEEMQPLEVVEAAEVVIDETLHPLQQFRGAALVLRRDIRQRGETQAEHGGAFRLEGLQRGREQEVHGKRMNSVLSPHQVERPPAMFAMNAYEGEEGDGSAFGVQQEQCALFAREEVRHRPRAE